MRFYREKPCVSIEESHAFLKRKATRFFRGKGSFPERASQMLFFRRGSHEVRDREGFTDTPKCLSFVRYRQSSYRGTSLITPPPPPRTPLKAYA